MAFHNRAMPAPAGLSLRVPEHGPHEAPAFAGVAEKGVRA
ncbi:hypothetical protein BHE75_03893 [Sphingomonas haloaromaticamans]|uniref:Uncharacterized protein n=1 Tax=Edaphosphingomonas haloaromaticamans TaxID=653954 RepID=A0A1S1HKB2_9SPHN|nr:hypothetical protein BHE75_03893 [Sphingomonas haloaromaticamans]